MHSYEEIKICDELASISNRHCASLVITPDFEKNIYGHIFPSQPSDKFENGTITFIKYKNRTYGITCFHVVNLFRRIKSTGNESYSLRTIVKDSYIIVDRFVRPDPEYLLPQPDIVISEINPALVEEIGKNSIDVDNMPDLMLPIKRGYAVGFPLKLKYKRPEQDGLTHRISMPHTEVCADIASFRNNERFTMINQLDTPIQVKDFSGMSGGPIYWGNEETWGLLGIVYESLTGTGLIDDKTIHISGEPISKDKLQMWTDSFHKQHGFLY